MKCCLRVTGIAFPQFFAVACDGSIVAATRPGGLATCPNRKCCIPSFLSVGRYDVD